MSLNGQLKLQTIREPNSIDNVINSLGKPSDFQHEKDTAIDGTVLYERKIVSYPGLTLRYPKHENFVVSKIELTSNQYYLCIKGIKLQVGMPTKELWDIIPDSKSKLRSNNKYINIDVAETNSQGNLKKGKNDNVSLSYKNLTIEINPSTNKVSKINISIRYT